MSWGEIKKALNSTVGTSKFKPLNEIIEEAVKKDYINVRKDVFLKGYPNYTGQRIITVTFSELSEIKYAYVYGSALSSINNTDVIFINGNLPKKNTDNANLSMSENVLTIILDTATYETNGYVVAIGTPA